MKTLSEKIAVMTAAMNGAEIEQTSLETGFKFVLICVPSWDWERFDFNVSQPLLEGWVNVYADRPGFFLHPTNAKAEAECGPRPVRCVHMREVREGQ